jgi:hypothetical protein
MNYPGQLNKSGLRSVRFLSPESNRRANSVMLTEKRFESDGIMAS